MNSVSLLPRKLVRTAHLLLAAFVLFSLIPRATHARKPFGPLAYRLIGPYRGGRVGTVTGVPSQPFVYYFGAAGGGGVWKTSDGGVNWEPLGDQTFKTGSVGAIAVSESDPNVVYVGMGEETLRGNVSHGDGMYKSTDAGKTWKKIGLEETRHIGRIRVHPR
ncbi:MAG: glycosyl hydrolase, partial [Acidobacteria bacterium]